MKGTFRIEHPNIVDITLTLTMPLGEWEILQEQLPEEWPSWRFSAVIGRLIAHAKQTFQEEQEAS